MAHKDASKIFSAWVLILQVASKCETRGVLARENGKPHTAESLAVKTRGNVEWFRIALDFLSSDEIGWLEIEPNLDECQHGDTQVSGNYQSSAEERKKEQKERTEQKECELREFIERIKKEYPSRVGSQDWKTAETKIQSIPIKERELVISGILGYKKSLEDNGSIGTKFVKQASTFFRNDIWREFQPEPPAPPKAWMPDTDWFDIPNEPGMYQHFKTGEKREWVA